jgi:hypothetical protein
MNQRGLTVPARVATVLGIALCACLLEVGSASALTYVPRGAFSETNGHVPNFSKPVGLTVDPATGDLLVADSETRTIQRFKPDGSPDDFANLGTNTIDGVGALPCIPPSPECDGTPQNELNLGGGNAREMQIAVAPPGASGGTAGDIYVAAFGSPLVNVFAPTGDFLGQLTGSSAGAFSVPIAGVTVDPAGAVYVSEFNLGTLAPEVHKYVPVANPVTNADNTANFLRPSFGHLAAGAGPTGGFIFSAEFPGRPAKVDSATGEEEYVVDPGESLALVVNPEDGHLFTADEVAVREWDASGLTAPLAPVHEISPGNGNIQAMAVDGARGLVYLAHEGSGTIEVWEAAIVPEVVSRPADPVGHEAATLRGEVNPSGLPLEECFFEWGETDHYGNLAPCEAPNGAEVGAGNSFVAVHAEAQLEAGSKYHFRLVATNQNTGSPIVGADMSFTTTGPRVGGEGASEVRATTARATANIDPNGEATNFVVQYLTEAAFQANPPGNRFAGAQEAPVGAQRTLPAVVLGSGNVREGSDRITEATATAGAFGPGEEIEGPGIPPGTKIASLQSPSELKLTTTATATTREAELSATGSQPVAQLITGLSPRSTYRFRFVAKNSGGITMGAGSGMNTAALPEEPRAEEAGCPNAAVRQGLAAGLPDCRGYELVSPPQKRGEVIPPEPNSELGSSCRKCLPGQLEGQIRPMQSSPSGDSVVYSGQPFSAGLSGGQNSYLGGRGGSGWSIDPINPLATTGAWEAFSEDLSRGLISQIEPPLAANAPARGGEVFANLYLAAAGVLTPLITEEPPNRDPGKSAAITNRLQVTFAAANAGAGSQGPLTHVAFEANDALTGPTASAPAAPLVSAGACVSSCDLYEWVGGQLRLVNVGPGNATALGEVTFGAGRLLEKEVPQEGAAVDNAMSADGSRIFFTSEETGQLYARLGGAKTLEVPGPGTCKQSVARTARTCYLTASEDGSEVLLSNGEIYRLNGSETAYAPIVDLTEGSGGFEGQLAIGEEASLISRIYFADSKALPRAAENAQGEIAKELAEHVNLYYWHHGSTRFVGSLLASDNQLGKPFGDWKAPQSNRTAQASPDGRYLTFMSGARLTGYDNTCPVSDLNHAETNFGPCPEVFEYEAETGTLNCASCNPSGQPPLGESNLTRLAPGGPSPDFRQPNNLSPAGNGRLFFESQDALLPQDTNGHIQDVYEWEPAGVGSCAKSGGCLRLISSGSSETDSMFMDASASGNDAFFIARQQLVVADDNQQLDLYDARVNGGVAPEEGPAPCIEEGCRGPVAEPPAQPGAASESFVGPGNPKQKPHHKKHKKHKHKKHSNHKQNSKDKNKKNSKHKKRSTKVDQGGAR